MIGLADLTNIEKITLVNVAQDRLVFWPQVPKSWGIIARAELDAPHYFWMFDEYTPSRPAVEFEVSTVRRLIDKAVLRELLPVNGPQQIMPEQDSTQLIRWLQGLD